MAGMRGPLVDTHRAQQSGLALVPPSPYSVAPVLPFDSAWCARKQLCNQDCVMAFVVHALHCHPSAIHTA